LLWHLCHIRSSLSVRLLFVWNNSKAVNRIFINSDTIYYTIIKFPLQIQICYIRTKLTCTLRTYLLVFLCAKAVKLSELFTTYFPFLLHNVDKSIVLNISYFDDDTSFDLVTPRIHDVLLFLLLGVSKSSAACSKLELCSLAPWEQWSELLLLNFRNAVSIYNIHSPKAGWFTNDTF
jgi:hypothetical protein